MNRLILATAALALLAFAEAQTSYKIEALPNSQTLISHAPYWDSGKGILYYVDVLSAKVFGYDLKNKVLYQAVVEGESYASFIIPIKDQDGKFVVGCGRRIAVVAWDGVSTTATVERYAYEVEQGDEYYLNAFNDGKADVTGRLVAGTLWNNQSDFYYARKGSLYSFEAGKPVKTLISNVGVSNGLTWNQATNKFYYVDSANQNVTEYDYDFSTGDISNPKVIYQNPDYFTDGLTIDTEGNIYLAAWGSRVYKINPSTQEVLLEIEFPIKDVTAVTFGGPNLDILFVTSSGRTAPAPAGSVYQVTGLGVQGLPSSKVIV